jgi:3-dehydroquinate synthase
MGMKSRLSDIDGSLPGAEELVDLMAQDKKVVDGQLRFILARGIGQAFVTSEIKRADVVTLLNDYLSDTV